MRLCSVTAAVSVFYQFVVSCTSSVAVVVVSAALASAAAAAGGSLTTSRRTSARPVDAVLPPVFDVRLPPSAAHVRGSVQQ